MKNALSYIAFIFIACIAAFVFSGRDAAKGPQTPWIVTEVDKPVGPDPGYIPADSEPPPRLFSIVCVSDESSIDLTYYGYPPAEFAVGETVYFTSGLRQWDRDPFGWPLDRASYSFAPNHDHIE
ncbi:MAG: hypothetical protein AAF664_21940 [Planctomycetota bacterium]